jgi:cardiolipin synthase C
VKVFNKRWDEIMKPESNLRQYKAFAIKRMAFFAFLLSTASTASADSIRYLARADQSLMQMAELVNTAQSSIDLTYYIVDPCSASTNILFNLLQEKSKKGVQVRIVVDSMTHGSHLQKQLHQYLGKSGIQLRYFNKGFTPMANYRSHAKIMIADGKRYITGGRNLADDYFGLQKQNFIDRDVYVSGPSAVQAQKKFDSFWSDPKTTGSSESIDPQSGGFEKICANLDLKKMQTLEAAIAKESKVTLATIPVAQCSDLKFTFDNAEFWHSGANVAQDSSLITNEEISDSKLEKKETTAEIFKFMKDNTKSLVFENWSYIPSKTINWILRDLRGQNIPILVVTNRTTDVGGPVDVLNKHYSERDSKGSQKVIGLSRLGSMNLSRSQTPAEAQWMIHSKVFVSNMENVAVTSFNLDPRSVHTNIETGLFVKGCPKFAEIVLKETGKLVDNFEKDKLCEACNASQSGSFLSVLKAWIGHELM